MTSYDAFGRRVSGIVGEVNRYGFTAREHDAGGFMHYRARFYDPTVGRFAQEDPLLATSTVGDAYAYVRGNPVSLTDPLGLCGSTSDCSVQCLEAHIGLTLAATASAVGSIPLSKRARGLPVAFGSSDETNVISYLGFLAFPGQARLPFSFAKTMRVFGVLGRINPYIAPFLFIADAISIDRCVDTCLCTSCKEG
jgi:RHS repeat-associated protein